MKKLLVSFVTGLAIGGVIVGIYSHRLKEQEVASVAFAHYLDDAHSAARTLRLIDDGRMDTVRKVLGTKLDLAVDSSYRLMAAHKPELGLLAPIFLPGMREAEEYLSERGEQAKTFIWIRDVTDYVEEAAEAYSKEAG